MKKGKSIIEELKNEGLLKPASEVPVPELKKKDELKEYLNELENEDLEIGVRFKALAKAKKVSIEDLFVWVEENYGKKVEKAAKSLKQGAEVIIQDFTKENAVGKPYNPFNNPLFKSKIDKAAK